MSERWHWQDNLSAWYGVGIYHVTLVVPSREPLLGELVIPDNDPKQAQVVRTDLGKEIVYIIGTIPQYHPEIRLLQYCLMPDHVHFILYVTKTMPQSIKSVIRGVWQSAKRVGREYSLTTHPHLSIRQQEDILSINPNDIRGNRQNNPTSTPHPIFTEVPFTRPMSRHGQLDTMMQYVKLNPQRLATKRLMPGFFRVQHDVTIAGRNYDIIGNIKILQSEHYAPVHVRSIWVEDAERHGDDTKLRSYKNGCILAARQGTVMVSPFISSHEKAVLDYLLQEQHTIIYIADNGFGEYYKPASALFDAVADGRMLILSPWQHDPDKKHVNRAECVAMNQMAEEICNA
jgi:REP element-mobilizing transposase RayT